MGFIRGGFFVLVGFLLFFSLLALNTSLALDFSLNYENVQKKTPSLLEDDYFEFDEAVVDTLINMPLHCQNNTDYVFNYQEQVISIPCSLQTDANEVSNEIINDFTEGIYYGEYNCNFWNCLTKEKTLFFLLSAKANNYWKEKVYFALFFTLVFVALLYFLVEQKVNWLVVVGGIFVFSSIVFLKIPSVISFFIPNSLGLLLVFLNIFFSKLLTVFWLTFIIGIIVLAGGLTLRIFGSDLIKKKFSRADVKKLVKKETSKSKTRK